MLNFRCRRQSFHRFQYVNRFLRKWLSPKDGELIEMSKSFGYLKDSALSVEVLKFADKDEVARHCAFVFSETEGFFSRLVIAYPCSHNRNEKQKAGSIHDHEPENIPSPIF